MLTIFSVWQFCSRAYHKEPRISLAAAQTYFCLLLASPKSISSFGRLKFCILLASRIFLCNALNYSERSSNNNCVFLSRSLKPWWPRWIHEPARHLYHTNQKYKLLRCQPWKTERNHFRWPLVVYETIRSTRRIKFGSDRATVREFDR